jgi:hypothetical protein
VDSESHHELKRRWSLRTLAWLLIGAVLSGYLIVIPSVDAFLQQFREQPTIIPATDLDTYELIRIRTAKFLVFAIFTYYGHVLQVLSMLSQRASHLGHRSPREHQRVPHAARLFAGLITYLSSVT